MAVRTLVALLVCTAAVFAQGKTSDSVIKASAVAKAEGGKRAVTITLDVDPKYYIYANPIGNKEFEDNQTTVSLAGKPKLGKVEYPAGEEVKDKVIGDYRVYRGKVTIKAEVEGAGPYEFAIKVQACSKSSCLLPATLKVTAP
ncbi:MAG: protein-disulfide reductase DsbD N-terminal domain-containing protein [Gemmataceae bacterium]